MHSQSDPLPWRHDEAFSSLSSSSSSRCPMYLAMCRQSSSSNMYIVTGGYPLCLRDIDLFTNRIRLDLVEPIRWFPSGALLCTYERYYFKVNRFSFWNSLVSNVTLIFNGGRDGREREGENGKTRICSSVFDRKERSNSIGAFYRLENEWIDDESEKLFARFITLLGDLTYAGYNELKLLSRPETIVDIPNFTVPQPKKTGTAFLSSIVFEWKHLDLLLAGFIVRNPPAFTILQSIFQQVSFERTSPSSDDDFLFASLS